MQALRAIDPELDHATAELLPPLQAVVDDAPATARPLFAANRALCDHADPVERLWQLATTVREFRGDAHHAVSRSLDVHLTQLRAKLGRPGPLTTIRGFGYRFGD